MLIISHRGAKGLAPENTKASFEAGLASKADMIEFDIRTTSDSQLVINHNPTLAGLTVASSTHQQLRAAYPELLTFEETIKIINNKRPLFVEIKKGADVRLVIKALGEVSLPDGSLLGSFNYSILKELRTAFPQIELVVIHKWSGVIATQRARRLGTKKIAMNHRWLWGGFIKSLTTSGYQLIPYTLNSPAKLKRWQKYDFYAVVTDFPDRFA